MLPGMPGDAGLPQPEADPQSQQPPAFQQAGQEAENVMVKAAEPQLEQPGEADAKMNVDAVSSPQASPAPSSSTMGAAGVPEEGAAAAAAAELPLPAGGGCAEQPPAKALATSAKQGKKKVVRTKDEFTEVWKTFMKSRQLDTSPQQFNRQALDLFKLFRLVLKAGGFQKVLEQKGWARIGRAFNPPPSMTDLSFQIKKAYINKLLTFEEAYNAGQLDAEFVLEGGGSPEPSTKAPPKRKASEPAEAPAEQLKAKRERQQPKQQQQQQQQQRKAKEEREGSGLVVVSPRPPQHPPSRHRAKQARPSKKQAALSAPKEAGKGGKSAKAAARPPSTAGGRGSRQDSGAAVGLEGRPPSGQRVKRQHVLQRRTEPAEVAASPEAMIGRRIGVFWADDDTFYHGTVVAYNPATERHTLQYDDGDREELAFLDKHKRAAREAAAAAAVNRDGMDVVQQIGPAVGPSAAEAAAAAAAAATGTQPHMQFAAGPHYQLQRDGSGPGSQEPASAGPMLYTAQEQAQRAQQKKQQPLGHLVLPDFAMPASGVPLPLFRRASPDDQPLLVPSLRPHGSLPGGLPGMLGEDSEAEPTPRYAAAQTLQWVANGGPPTMAAPPPGQPPVRHPAAQQQHWLYESQQQFAQHGGSYSSQFGGFPPSGPLPAAHAASLGLPPQAPRPTPAGVGAFLPVPPPTAHRHPHELVAQGRNFRAYTTLDPAAGYEVFALVPGLTADEVSVRCWSSGVVLIEGEPASTPRGPGAQPPLSEHVQLPTRIDTRSAIAQLTPTGQLYLRVNAV